MEWFWYTVVFVLGTIIGSFLNVVLYRMHTGKSLGGRSHCMTCGKTLAWHELFPIVSYLFSGGRCKGCSAHIPSRYLIVELLTGLSFVLMWHFFAHNILLLVLNFILIATLVVIVIYDIRHTIIPDECTALLLVLAFSFLAYEWNVEQDLLLVLSSLLSGAGAALFFWGLWYISKGRWIGFGDAKFAFPLGVIVGAGGVFSMVVLSFWLGAAISLALLGLQRLIRRGKIRLNFRLTPRTIKSEVPFAPFLTLGFLLVHLLHADIFNIAYVLFFSY